jgi:hypothetical protein
MFRKAQTGFSIVAAIFIVVVLAALAAALLTVASLQHSSAGLDAGCAAYQAAQRVSNGASIASSTRTTCPTRR